MSPSLPTPAFLYILNILLSPTLPKFPVFHNCHATPKRHGLPTQPPKKKNSERAPDISLEYEIVTQPNLAKLISGEYQHMALLYDRVPTLKLE